MEMHNIVKAIHALIRENFVAISELTENEIAIRYPGGRTFVLAIRELTNSDGSQ